jgi:hypothetical protein
VLFWVGAACGVFALSGLAFWLMPRGETNLGAPQVAYCPSLPTPWIMLLLSRMLTWRPYL